VAADASVRVSDCLASVRVSDCLVSADRPIKLVRRESRLQMVMAFSCFSSSSYYLNK
jgi:hypothetical protein